jgi:hypothetical protein
VSDSRKGVGPGAAAGGLLLAICRACSHEGGEAFNSVRSAERAVQDGVVADSVAGESFAAGRGLHEPWHPNTSEGRWWEEGDTRESAIPYGEEPIFGAKPPLPHGSSLPFASLEGSGSDVDQALKTHADLKSDPQFVQHWTPSHNESILGARLTGYAADNDFAAVDAARPAKQPRLLTAVPRSEAEYARVYGKQPNVAQLRELAETTKQLNAEDALFQDSLDADGLRAMIYAHAHDTPLVIVAHSTDEGTILVLPSGEVVTSSRVHEWCLIASASCVILTCHGADVALRAPISTSEALRMWKAGATVAQVNEDATVGDVVSAMRAERDRKDTGKVIIVGVVGFAGAGGAGVYAYRSIHDESQERGPAKHT